MQPAAAAVAAVAVAAGNHELATMVLAATQASAADFIPSVTQSTAVPLADAKRVRIDVTYQEITVAASITAIAVTVQ